MAWVEPDTIAADRERIIGAGCGQRVHAHVATRPIEPLGPAEAVGDLLRLHETA